MKNFTLGVLLGSLLTVGVVGANDKFYNSDGEPSAKRGSTKQFDYYRQRQQFLDVQALRNAAEQDRNRKSVNPCAK